MSALLCTVTIRKGNSVVSVPEHQSWYTGGAGCREVHAGACRRQLSRQGQGQGQEGSQEGRSNCLSGLPQVLITLQHPGQDLCHSLLPTTGCLSLSLTL